ncbi:alpha/beta hydrolase [Leucobacter japonicus]|uniref:alpha/beta hydrolase n=1 Tax=Leucobacter japonicus TaxID=1461259 RepID=UPI000ABE9348|nr:alpha/beta hydrolase [Leucobacter japonicus]
MTRPSGRRPAPRGRLVSPLLAGMALVALAAAVPVAVIAPGPAVSAEADPLATQEAQPVSITDLTVAGPARGAILDSPNRLGLPAVPVRAYEPEGAAWATLVWAHGGSFVHGTLDGPESDWVSRRFAEAGVRVYAVGYGVASDSVKAPAPANDVAAVLAWVAARTDGPIAVGGASAGGQLAVQAALQQADRADADPLGVVRRADAVLLEYPTLHRVQQHDATIAAATAGVIERRRFSAERIAEMYDYYLGGAAEPADGSANANVVGELPAARLAALPATVIVNADLDDLRASGEQFAAQLREAGVPVAESLQPGTDHGYLSRPQESPETDAAARETIERFVAELREIVAAR